MKNVICLVVILMLSSSLLADQNEKKVKQVKPALLVIDIQNKYLPYMSDKDKKFAMEMINGAIWLFRQHNFPVIRVYNTNPEWGPKPDTEEFEFPKSINISPDDPKIIKNFPSAFKETDLEELLKEKEINTVYLCGLSAVGCVLATYHGAMERDYNVFMIKDALLSHDAEYTNFVEEIMDTVSFKTLRFMLDNTKK